MRHSIHCCTYSNVELYFATRTVNPLLCFVVSCTLSEVPTVYTIKFLLDTTTELSLKLSFVRVWISPFLLGHEDV